MTGEDRQQANGWVALVGAGPGDPGLMTVRGLRKLHECDVLVYDNLMADEFVALASGKETIFVGKASGKHAVPQEEINQLLVRLAKEGKNVVRLKGGDPFVFGRGGEECRDLREAGIAYEVVPGVTAGIAGSAYAGVPVTHRELSRGVTLVTGHFAKDREVELPWQSLVGLGHTLVFYMAVASTGHVAERLIDAGMDPDTPTMVVERATTGAQRRIVATIRTIAEEIRKGGVIPPGILVVGDVVRLGDELAWLPSHPLAGKKIVFTRAVESTYDAVDRLRSLGAEVLDIPVVIADARKGDAELMQAVDNLDEFPCIAFTSALAVDLFFKAMRDRGMDVRRLSGHTIAAAGKTVIRSLRSRGVVADCTPDRLGGERLGEVLGQSGLEPGSKVLLPRSSAADDSLPESLEALGFVPVHVSVYDSRPLNLDWLKVKLSHWRPDAVTFLSGTGVRTVMNSVPQLAHAENPPVWACVGRKTAKALAQIGPRADVVPDLPDVDEMVNLVIEKLIRKDAGTSS